MPRRQIGLREFGSWMADRGGPQQIGINYRRAHQCKITESTLENAKARAAQTGWPAAVQCYECKVVFRVDVNGKAV